MKALSCRAAHENRNSVLLQNSCKVVVLLLLVKALSLGHHSSTEEVCNAGKAVGRSLVKLTAQSLCTWECCLHASVQYAGGEQVLGTGEQMQHTHMAGHWAAVKVLEEFIRKSFSLESPFGWLRL